MPCSFRSFEGWLTTLPLCLDQFRLRRAFDTEALAASFPFAAADPPIDPDGVFYGLTPAGAPIILDRFQHDNYNTVLLARSGAGKSYLAKLEALRLLYRGVQVFVIDPEDEYRRLTTQSAASISRSRARTPSRSTRSTSPPAAARTLSTSARSS